MEHAAELLTIILSAVLVVFLIVSIVAVVKLIQVIKSLKRITEKAEKLADSAEAIGSFFEKSAGPAAIGKFVYNIISHVMHREKKDK